MPRFGISIYCISRKIRTGELSPIAAYDRLCEMGADLSYIHPNRGLTVRAAYNKGSMAKLLSRVE